MKAKELRSMEPTAIQEEIAKLRKEQLELKCKVALGEDVRAHRISETRREIARMLTVLREKDGEAK